MWILALYFAIVIGAYLFVDSPIFSYDLLMKIWEAEDKFGRERHMEVEKIVMIGGKHDGLSWTVAKGRLSEIKYPDVVGWEIYNRTKEVDDKGRIIFRCKDDD